MVPAEAMVPEGPARVPASGSVTGHSSRLAGRVNRKHDRQSGECHKHQPSRTSQLVHGVTSLSPLIPWDDTA
jgi:hypothetical protein